ncbi:hypothetical protein ABIE38_002537 [Dietzia sp. 2505]|uniref:hypothetical protein n=1 Tax=Dietzia sp. 2505 TaxID=3156457 RepID=UPI00339B721F
MDHTEDERQPADDGEGAEAGTDIDAQLQRWEELDRRVAYRRQQLKSVIQPSDIVTLIAAVVIFYLALAWLFISPMIKAFWPW